MDIKDILLQCCNNDFFTIKDEEDFNNNLENIVKDFDDKFRIVPKEQWCVTITTSDSINSTTVIGPFENEKVATLFATIWNRKRDEFIDKTIEDNPDKEYNFLYIKANPNKIDWSEQCDEIREEIFEALKNL